MCARERGGDLVECGKPRSLLFDPLAQELVLPRRQAVELEREDHHRSTGHPAQLGEAGRGGFQWWIVTHAIAASTAPSSSGSASA